MSLFRRKKSSAKLNKQPSPEPSSTPSLPTSRLTASLSHAPPTSSWDTPSTHVDDFGRPISTLQPAFSPYGGSAPFGAGFGVGEDEIQGETALLYGYTPLSTTLELSVVQVEEIVARCAASIRKQGLDTPLVLSSTALDISLEGVCSLIRAYVDDPQGWARDLDLAAPLSVGAFLKWGLARLISDRGGRGFVSWEVYSDFKTAERATGYPLKSATVHLISRLSASHGRLLSTLLSLFSSVIAHSGKNGMLPRRLAALFSPYVFGLPDDRSFDETYREWQRATDAVEHIILSFIRDQKADGPLPTFLERFVIGYPAILDIETNGAASKIPKGVRVEEVMRVKRLARFHSRNLIQQSATWQVPHSTSWKLLLDHTNSSSTPVFTPSYRHLLNIRSNHGLDDESAAYEDDGELQKYRSGVERDWGIFGDSGFKEVDSKKLEFDLTEGERNQKPVARENLDWSTFETSGFSGREMFAPTDLVFHQTIGNRVATWPSSQKALTDRLRAAEAALPPFPYDTSPAETGRVVIEKDFIEAWADVLVGGGWARDELKESSFALLHWKARPRDGELPKGRIGASDPRSEERWVLVEEVVPREYREALMADPKARPKASKRVSFMRAVRRKSGQQLPAPVHTSPRSPGPAGPSFTNLAPATLSSSYNGRKDNSLRPIDEAIHSDTTHFLSASTVNLDRASYAPTSYAPSIVSTVRAMDGHAAMSTTTLPHTGTPSNLPPAVPSPSNNGFGIGGTLSSQPREPAFAGNGGPVSYDKPLLLTKKSTFLSKIRKGGSNSSPIPTTAGEAIAASSTAAPSSPSPQCQQPRHAVSQLPLSPGRSQVSNGMAVPANSHIIMPGAPPLAPVAHHVPHESSPPLPPKDRREVSTSTNTYDTVLSAHDDPYGGLDEEELEEGEAETGGEVLFRGSQSFPRELNVQAGDVVSGIRRLSVDHPSSPPRRVPAQLDVPASHPPRSHSLQDSPKPDAEVPIDEDDSRFPHDQRYLSGASQFSTRVAGIAAIYEQKDRRQQPQHPSEGVRLTQYGFNDNASPLPPPIDYR